MERACIKLNVISGSQNASLQTTWWVTLISVHKLASFNSLQLSNRENKINLHMLALKKNIYKYYCRKPMFLTKTNWELSNSMQSLKTILVTRIAHPMVAVATSTPASKYSVLRCIITKTVYQPLQGALTLRFSSPFRLMGLAGIESSTRELLPYIWVLSHILLASIISLSPADCPYSTCKGDGFSHRMRGYANHCLHRVCLITEDAGTPTSPCETLALFS